MSKRGRPPHPDILTPREWEVLALLRLELSNPEIAERLGISRDGAKYHVSQILGKLGLESREQAARWQSEEAQPWWATAFAPLGSVWRQLSPASGVAARASLVVVILAAVGGLGLLALLLFMQSDDGDDALVGQTPAPSSAQLSYVDEAGTLWLVNADGSDRRKLADDVPCGVQMQWSPAGEILLCQGAGRAVFLDGEGALIGEVSDPDAALGLMYWSSSGAYVLYNTSEGGGAETTYELHIADRSGSEITNLGPWDAVGYRPPQLFLGSSLWSPDGQKIFFTRPETGESAIYSVDTAASEVLDKNHYPLGWVLGGEALLVATGYEDELFSLAPPSYKANLLDLATGALTRIPELDNGVQFWISPSGSHIAAAHVRRQTDETDPPDIIIFDLRNETATPIPNSVFTYPSEGIPREHLVFSQDGQRVFWLNALPFMLYSASLDGSDFQGPVALGTRRIRFSPDRSAFAYEDFDSATDTRVLIVQNIDGSDTREINRIPADGSLSFAWRPLSR